MEEAYVWVWVLVPLAGMAIGALAIYLDHKKKMAMIEKGMNPDESEIKKWKRGRKGMLTGGLVMMGVGAAFLITAVTVWVEAAPWLYLGGLLCGFIGIALIISYGIEHPR